MRQITLFHLFIMYEKSTFSDWLYEYVFEVSLILPAIILGLLMFLVPLIVSKLIEDEDKDKSPDAHPLRWYDNLLGSFIGIGVGCLPLISIYLMMAFVIGMIISMCYC